MRSRPQDLVLLLASVAAGLGAVEVGLRAANIGPWSRFSSFDDLPVLTQAHPTLGWENRPGVHDYAGADGTQVAVRISPAGTRSDHADGEPWVMGGSFAFGFGVTQPAILTEQLGDLRPDLAPVNYAVPGYGTVQSALLWEALGAPPRTVVYGLTDLHDGRNVAARAWLHALDRAGPKHDWAGVPSAVWDGTELRRSPPRRYAHWELSEHIALVDLVERASLRVQDRFLRTKSETTVQLIVEWRDALAAAGGELVVAVLHAPSRERYYQRRLMEEGVRCVDLQDPRFPDAAVVGDGHPDASIHAGWAARLAEAL